jgi:phosphate starvation-inducible PhoH-like protein
MRGRTLEKAFIILDEAQNTLPAQMKMFLTRMGVGSKMIVNGDLSQIDLPNKKESGLIQAAEVLGKLDNVAFVQFTGEDVVRHPRKRHCAAYDNGIKNTRRGKPNDCAYFINR